MKITDNSRQYFLLSAKISGTQRRMPVSPWRKHCMYSSMPKGTSQAEVMLNSKKTKPIPLHIVELRLKALGSQSGTQYQ